MFTPCKMGASLTHTLLSGACLFTVTGVLELYGWTILIVVVAVLYIGSKVRPWLNGRSQQSVTSSYKKMGRFYQKITTALSCDCFFSVVISAIGYVCLSLCSCFSSSSFTSSPPVPVFFLLLMLLLLHHLFLLLLLLFLLLLPPFSSSSYSLLLLIL